MEKDDTIVAVFDDHQAAEAAVKKLAGAGIDIKHLSVVGKGYHIDEKIVGFYNTGDRVKFWGQGRRFLGRPLGLAWRAVPDHPRRWPRHRDRIPCRYSPFRDRGRNRGGRPERIGCGPLQRRYPERQRDRVRGGRED